MILLADECDKRAVAEALQHGVRGCMSPRAPPADWVHAVLAVHRGEMWMARRALASVLDDLLTRLERNEHASAEWQGVLSGRESQVANAVRQGLTNKEIARLLHISDATVKTHIENIFHKLNVTRRVQLAMFAGTDAQTGAAMPDASER